MSLPLAVLFGVVMGCATLVAVCIFASLLTWILCEVWEAAARAQAATDFAVLARRARLLLQSGFWNDFHRESAAEIPQAFFVCLCRNPLTSPEYFCGFENREPKFSAKDHALKFLACDLHVIRAVTLRLENDGDTVFVCFHQVSRV